VRYYSERLSTHGASPRGADWSSEASQQLRFTQLLRVADADADIDLLDWGCGYGALAQRLIADGGAFRYVGFDICAPMVEAARGLIDDPRCRFTDREDDLGTAGVTVASGIFNVRLETSEPDWHAYVQDTLDRIAAVSRDGFAFNMLTRFADPPLMRDDLYYADPTRYFTLCKERYSRNVSLLHDYDLFEFTIVVRVGAEPKPLA
jgi:SAM-dependent methyltransferase